MSNLEAVFAGTAVPPTQLVVVQHALSTPPEPLVCEVLARGQARGQASLLICVLQPPDAYLPGWESRGTAIDLSGAVPGFSEDVDIEVKIKSACQNLPAGAQVFLDAPDVLAEDYGVAVATRVVRTLLAAVKASKPPSRLIMASPAGSAFTEDILASTLSAGLTLLTPHAPPTLEHLSRSYLLPADTSPRFWQALDAASARGVGDALALRGAESSEVAPRDAWAVQVLVRKPTGGAKAIVRALDGMKRGDDKGRWQTVALEDVVEPTTHADLNLPFNLQLTDSQREARGAVPLPYAHEGEGADLGMGMDWSDDEEDDEI